MLKPRAPGLPWVWGQKRLAPGQLSASAGVTENTWKALGGFKLLRQPVARAACANLLEPLLTTSRDADGSLCCLTQELQRCKPGPFQELEAPPCSTPTLSPLLPTAQPEWLKVISDMEADIGSSLRWGCAAAGKPRPTVRWLRNGEPLASQVADLGLPPTPLPPRPPPPPR